MRGCRSDWPGLCFFLLLSTLVCCQPTKLILDCFWLINFPISLPPPLQASMSTRALSALSAGHFQASTIESFPGSGLMAGYESLFEAYSVVFCSTFVLLERWGGGGVMGPDKIITRFFGQMISLSNVMVVNCFTTLFNPPPPLALSL